MVKHLRQEHGYSLVEVMVSIMILAIAIIPMVGMFDMGLNAATSSGNYDRARTFANQQLEGAKNMSYDNVRDKFPVNSSTPNPTYTSPPQTTGVPQGLASYVVEKRFVDERLANSSTNKGMMKITVTVSWGSNNSYTTTGVVGK